MLLGGQIACYRHAVWICLVLLRCSWSYASEGEWEHELDPYYTNIAYFKNLDDSPIPELGQVSEIQVYKDLFYRS